MYLHREGRNTLILFLILLLASIFVGLFFDLHSLIRVLIVLPFAILFGLILWFFRVPQRHYTAAANQIVAPADGKVVVIEKTTEKEYLKDERIQISIFMSPLNVHQNVYPVGGEVSYTQYHKGKYLVAWHPKSSELNERSTVVVKHSSGTEILFRQIAGAVARRICSYPKVGDKAAAGSEMGFIKFGSRVDVFLPVDAKIHVKIGDTTRNSETVLAEL